MSIKAHLVYIYEIYFPIYFSNSVEGKMLYMGEKPSVGSVAAGGYYLFQMKIHVSYKEKCKYKKQQPIKTK